MSVPAKTSNLCYLCGANTKNRLRVYTNSEHRYRCSVCPPVTKVVKIKAAAKPGVRTLRKEAAAARAKYRELIQRATLAPTLPPAPACDRCPVTVPVHSPHLPSGASLGAGLPFGDALQRLKFTLDAGLDSELMSLVGMAAVYSAGNRTAKPEFEAALAWVRRVAIAHSEAEDAFLTEAGRESQA